MAGVASKKTTQKAPETAAVKPAAKAAEKTAAKAAPVKTEETKAPAKKEESKAAEKPEVKAAPAKTEEKKAPAKKAAAKKTTAKKSSKKGAKRGPKPASERTIDLQVQYQGRDVSYTDLVNRIKDMWKEQGKRETSLKNLNIYVKPEEFKAYYVINGNIKGEIEF
jgi:hypothetical protein